MKKTFITLSCAIIISTLATTSIAVEMSGKEIAFERKLGNCLACHKIAGGDLAGNIAPPLIAMKARFPDRSVLRAQIADATVKNPYSIMIPFEKHGVLTKAQIDKVTDFIHTL